jgi:hypothetical protein
MRSKILLLAISIFVSACAKQMPRSVETQSTDQSSESAGFSGAPLPQIPGAPTNELPVTNPVPTGMPTTASAQDYRAIVIKAYREVLDRSDYELSHDEAGIRYWVGRMEAGVSESAVRSSMRASTEYFVRSQYKAILGRPVDLGGLYYYLYEIESGRMTRSQFVNHLVPVCSNQINGEC